MKADRLEEMLRKGINIPKFILVSKYDSSINLSFSKSKYFAVRSSCNIEDSSNNSYAGQFKTILNCERKNVRKAVNEVIDSYNGYDGKVIIQEMIQSNVSGVIFTSNPLGILSESIIEIGYGTGDNVVDNKVRTTSYTYNKDNKSFRLTRSYDDTPVLSTELLYELINTGDKIKNIFGFEADIEFAIHRGIIYILQARPITTCNTENVVILDNSNIVESYPGVALPLTQDFVTDIYYRIFKNCIDRITGGKGLSERIDNNLRNMVATVNWHFYYQINNWYTILKLLPFSSLIVPIWQRMLGVSNKNIEYTKVKLERHIKSNILKNFIHYLMVIPNEMDKLNESFESKYINYMQCIDREDDIEHLVRIFECAKNDFLNNWDITLINDMYTFINVHLAGRSSNISDIKGLASREQVEAFNKLRINNQHAIDEYIQKYGDRCIGELKLETKTFRTNPELLIRYIQENDTKSDSNLNSVVKSNYNNIFSKRAKVGIKNREISRLNRSRLFGMVRAISIKIGIQFEKLGILDDYRDIFYLHIDEIKSYKVIKSADIKSRVTSRKLDEIRYNNSIMPRRIEFSNKIQTEIQAINKGVKTIENDTLRGDIVSQNKEHETIYGEVIVIKSADEKVDTTDKIIVTHTTDPGWSILIKNSIGVIAEQGSLLSHTAIISRELNKVAVVNIDNATTILKSGDKIKINQLSGEITIINKSRSNYDV